MSAPAARRATGGRVEPTTGLLPVHPTHYERLGVPANAGPAQIDQAWQQRQPDVAPPQPLLTPSLALPGTSPSPALDAAALRLAYEVLRDPARRAVYDAWLLREAAGAALQSHRQRGWRRFGVKRTAVLLVLAVAVVAGLAWWLGGFSSVD